MPTLHGPVIGIYNIQERWKEEFFVHFILVMVCEYTSRSLLGGRQGRNDK